LHPEANVALVLPISDRGQTWKTDVDMHSFRNVLAYAAAVVAHHFVTGEWNQPTDLSGDSEIVVDAYWKSMKPKDPWQIVNHDLTQ
jgi:hypothetical protein